MSVKQSIVDLKNKVHQCILGQQNLVEKMFITLLADGHLLVEGAPGLAKTTAIKTLASGIEGNFHRIQFTPDLLPADLTGTEIYRPQDGSFHFEQGPLFHCMLLADEINRAPAKVQSALLEAMAERQVTIGKKSYTLPPLFFVMATQNPIEQQGTYPLPEAQLDRFLLHVEVGYPDIQAEHGILALERQKALEPTTNITMSLSDNKVSQQDIFAARNEVLSLYMSQAVEDYIVEIVLTSRDPKKYSDDLARLIQYGASPRGTIALERAAKAHAWLNDKDYVSPDDVQAIANDVLRHRLILSYEAEMENITSQHVSERILQTVPAP